MKTSNGMKTFSIQVVYKVLAVGVIGALLGVAYIANPSFLKAPRAESAVVASPNISGWVWSLGTKVGSEAADSPTGTYSTTPGSNPGLGWISFNSTSDESSQAYGTKVDTTTKGTGGVGNFSGNAWGENVGWISFDRAETGIPPGPPFDGASGPIAQVDWSTGKVTGWMRVLAGADAQAGGWDGWIKLSDTAGGSATYTTAGSLAAGSLTPKCSCDSGAGYNCSSPFTGSDVGVVCYDQWATSGGPSKIFNRTSSSPAYGVQISANKFSGYAWGGDVVGWVDFAPKIGGVSVGPVIGAPPCVATDTSISWGTCQPLPSSICAAPPTTKVIANGGIRVGACTSGGTTTGPCDVTVACTPPVVVTPPPSGCNANPACDGGETPLTCPSQCKVKYKQF